ncbi:ABC transporter permease [Solwaraspora sp. WMMD791]|uniref:ABC transporter permease n=1 Tax=Solwaraspora sp. WMMD791 TaxID=3016086 RepID=UPI00249ACB33|nr:ABC transporter permease [Solwaraspora sp. WMMD791]WFE30602.1 ABC transporter permease [Solwaraspora sp. WMMD791]
MSEQLTATGGAAPAPAAGVIHDIGYQRYTGQRLGRRHVFGALYAHSLRTAFGLGRSAKAKIFPWFIVGVVVVVAAGLVTVRAQFGQVLLTYAQFADAMSWLVIFFVAVVAPELVSRDIGSGVLPLYFSRPLRLVDYPLAKFAALASAVFLLLGAPQLVMFLGGAFTTDTGWSGVWDEVTDLAPGLVYAMLWAAVFSAIGLVVASVTGKRAFAAGGVVAVFLMTAPIVGVLSVLPSVTANQLAGLAAPSSLVQGTGLWLFRDALVTSPDGGGSIGIGSFGPLYGLVTLVLIAGCFAALIARYRKAARQ